MSASDDRRAHPFLQRLQAGPILADGGMGTMLYRRGVSFERCFDELNISAPEIVAGIHRDYLDAGALLIETNTFGGNRLRLASHGFEDRVRAINLRGVKLAREAREVSGVDAFVAGSVGPVGRGIAPIGTVPETEARAAFDEQIGALLEGGVDLFIVETMSDLREVTIAVEAIRAQTADLPVVALLTFSEEGTTLTGRTPEDIGHALSELPIDCAGANCSVGPQGMLEVIHRMAAVCSKPLVAMPNAGMPQLVDGRFVYATTPAYLAGFVGPYCAHGVRIIGGCCGTTPDHIAAMAQEIANWQDRIRDGRTEVRVVTHAEPEPEDTPVDSATRSTFAQNLGKRFQVSIELDPPRGTSVRKILDGARLCREHGVDAVNIADSPMARVRMSAIAIAAMIERDIGVETILHCTCRDRNLMGLQSDMIGAHALGIRNVLAVTGDPPTVGDYPHSTGVYDVDAIGLVRVLAALNAGRDHAGAAIGRATNLTIGVALNPVADDWETELRRYREKVEAGAQFAFTQPLFRLDPLKRCLDQVSELGIPIFLGLLPLMSFRHAWYLHNEVPGIRVPDADLQQLEEAGEKGAEVGVAICRGLLEQARGLVAGAYLMPSFGRYETCLRVIEGLVEPRTDNRLFANRI